MNPKYERVAKRLEELIAEGLEVAQLERPSQYNASSYIQDNVALHQWLVKVDNAVRTTFGTDSAHFLHLNQVLSGRPSHAYEILNMVGVLKGALNDLQGGFLARQDQLVAGVVFDSVLEQARHLLNSGFKDPAAILGRVVIEDCLRRLCRAEGLPDSAKAASLNDSLRDKGRYGKPQWRLVQLWLDVGNAAAHGQFSEYDPATVGRMIDDIERFVAQELGA